MLDDINERLRQPIHFPSQKEHDIRFACQIRKKELEDALQLYRDRAISAGMDEACRRDENMIETFAAEERQARVDYERAHADAGEDVTPPSDLMRQQTRRPDGATVARLEAMQGHGQHGGTLPCLEPVKWSFQELEEVAGLYDQSSRGDGAPDFIARIECVACADEDPRVWMMNNACGHR